MFLRHSECESTKLGMQPSLDSQMRANGTNKALFFPPRHKIAFPHVPEKIKTWQWMLAAKRIQELGEIVMLMKAFWTKWHKASLSPLSE